MKGLKQFAAIGALTVVVALSFGAGSANAAPNENACTGVAVSDAAQLGKDFGGSRGLAGAFRDGGLTPQDIGPSIRAFNESCHSEV